MIKYVCVFVCAKVNKSQKRAAGSEKVNITKVCSVATWKCSWLMTAYFNCHLVMITRRMLSWTWAFSTVLEDNIRCMYVYAFRCFYVLIYEVGSKIIADFVFFFFVLSKCLFIHEYPFCPLQSNLYKQFGCMVW